MSDLGAGRPRAVFVRTNVSDYEGDIYRAVAGETPESFDIYTQTPGTFPTLDCCCESLEDAVCEAKRLAEFAGCSLVLELWGETREVKPDQFVGLEWCITWGWLTQLAARLGACDCDDRNCVHHCNPEAGE